MIRFGYDVTNGVVIGEIDHKKHYTFHNKDGNAFASGNFDNDKEAENYIKTMYFDHYKNGLEMRVYN